VGRGTTSRYAGALAGALVALVLTAACGSAPAAYGPEPVRTPATATPAVTAPASADLVVPQPVFSAAEAPAVAPQPLTIERQEPVNASSPAVTPPPASGAGPIIVQAPIPYPASRLQEMAAYSLRHYGTASWQLTPTVIVLHYTAGGTWSGARAMFAADSVNMGELPGTCSHFVVDKDGTVYQLVPTSIRCRHTIGLNDQAIGIEMVQEGGPSADRQILDRPAQVGAALALVRRLQAQFGIPTANVIGHAMANSAPQFHDARGWRNDHADWVAADMAEFRARL
jgi:hypothetical protein